MQNITNALEALGEPLLWTELRRIMYLPGLMLCVIGISLTVIAAPSNLDPTFGNGGKVVSSPDGSQMIYGSTMALQSDGKIVMVGSRVVASTYSTFVVARYNADGSLDTTFGNNGWSSATFGADYEFAASVAIHPDGKIVVGGIIWNSGNDVPTRDFAIARFNSDGSIDTTFDSDGKITISFNDLIGTFYQEYLSVLKIGSDGKIVVAGHAIDSSVADRFIFARINADGSLDTTFGTDGRLADVANMFSNYDKIGDLIILPDGKFVVAAAFHNFMGSFRLAIKYNINGGREWTYRKPDTASSPYFDEALNGIAVLPDGKFIVVGKRLGKIVALRLNADGTEDNTFLNPAMPDGEALSVAIQSDGKIVANIITATSSSFSLVRYNANGSLDTAFGNGGIIRTIVTSGVDSGRKVLIQPDGKILVGGSSTLSSPTRYYFTMVRYQGEFASPFTLFDYDNDGRADVSVFRPSENKWFVLRSSDLGVTQPYFAIAGDVPVPSDYDGDGKTDFAVFRPSTGDWWYLSSINNSQNFTHWGQSGDIPRPSDFDGDGRSDFVLFRPSNSVWYRFGSTGVTSITEFGLTGDKPVSGDFDGDGKSDLAIYRPSTGDWWYQSSINNAWLPTHWGISTDVPAPADFDGDGKTDVAVYRPSTGTWYILNSSNGSFTFVNFGVSEDKPVPADYDGDAKADIAVFRPSNGTWYLQQTTAGFGAIQWGVATDIPTENAFIP